MAIKFIESPDRGTSDLDKHLYFTKHWSDLARSPIRYRRGLTDQPPFSSFLPKCSHINLFEGSDSRYTI